MEKEIRLIESVCNSLFQNSIFNNELLVSYSNLLPLLADSTLQQGMNYNSFVVPRIRRIENEYSFFSKISQVPMEKDFVSNFLNVNNHRKINMFIDILQLLVKEGIETISNFYTWVQEKINQQKLLNIHGFGHKTLDYILNLLGIQSIPIDRHIYKFLNVCGIEIRNYEKASTIINLTAEKNGYNKIGMDREIWNFMKTITI